MVTYILYNPFVLCISPFGKCNAIQKLRVSGYSRKMEISTGASDRAYERRRMCTI